MGFPLVLGAAAGRAAGCGLLSVRSGLEGVDLHAGGGGVDVVLAEEFGEFLVKRCGAGRGAAAGAFCHGGRTTTGLVLDLGVGVEVGAAVDDLDVLEAGGEEAGAVVLDWNGAGDAADVGGHTAGDGLWELCLERDVADGEAAAGLAGEGLLLAGEVCTGRSSLACGCV